MSVNKHCKVIELLVLIVYLTRHVSCANSVMQPHPVILSAKVLNVTELVEKFSDTEGYFNAFLIEFEGSDFKSDMVVRLTSTLAKRGNACVDFIDESDYVVRTSRPRPSTTKAHMVLVRPSSSETMLSSRPMLYVCLKIQHSQSSDVELQTSKSSFQYNGEVIKWIHQGADVGIQLLGTSFGGRPRPTSGNANQQPHSIQLPEHTGNIGLHAIGNYVDRKRREVSIRDRNERTVRVVGIRVESADKDPLYGDDGVPELLAGRKAVIRLYGMGFTNTTQVTFTSRTDESNCEFPITDSFPVEVDSITEFSALAKIRVPPINEGDGAYYVCLKEITGNTTESQPWKHQGSKTWLAIRSYQKLLPIWLSIMIIVTCLTFSALFSGLNLGLMSMDQTDLKIVSNTGSEAEKRYARAIMPVRKTGNYLLCSILLGNVLVNSSLTILIDDLTSGLVAIIGSTMAIVIFGEITPQAICSRHGLAVGAKTIYVTKMVMFVTFPLSWPISKLLDYLLGVELGNVYTRERLKELVKVTTEYNDLEKDEVNIISGALELRKKMVKDVMTKLEDCFMLSYDTVLDFETVSEIMKQGYSRIPVYEGQRTNIVTALYIKDLAFVDPDDNTPLKTLCKFYQNPCNFVFEDTTLDVMFKQFKEGIKGHMAFVHRVNSEGEGDPFYETVGLVTLEDVIEELIQAEIVDETDVWTDNRSKRRRNEKTSKQDFTIFAERRENQSIYISPQLTLATFQYLSATVDAFKPEIISETILRRLLKQDVIYHVKVKNKDKVDSIIYTQGQAVDYFVLILEGRVEVMVGKENLRFESGPFTYFGTQALTQNISIVESPISPSPQNMGSLLSVNLEALQRHTFVPDYTVRALSEVFYVRIKRSLYLAAKRATLMELAKKDTQSAEHFDDEVEKLLHSLDEEDRSLPNSPTLSHRDQSHHLSQNDKDALQRCIMAAERGGGLTGPDMNLLQSLSSSNGVSRSPSHAIAVGFSTECEPNLSVSMNNIDEKVRRVSVEIVNPVDIANEERTTLLPQPAAGNGKAS